MGNGGSCTRVEQYDASVQMPSISPTKSGSSFSSSGRPSKPGQDRTPITPIPEEGFAPKANLDQYSSVWDRESKVSSFSLSTPSIQLF